MKYFSMFSGIGGFEKAIQTTIPTAKCVGFSEIDKYAIKVYERQFNGHTNYGDVSICDIIGVCSNQFVTNVELENLYQKAKTITESGVLNVVEKPIVITPENDTKEILISLESIAENTGEKTQKREQIIKENIQKCYENGCLVCMEISANVVANQKKNFSASTISKMMAKWIEKNMGTALFLLCSTLQKNTNQENIKYFVITVTMQEQGGVYVHTERTVNWGDATKINPTELPDFDLLVGGFPCQAFSIAGKRNGFNDTRGTLFFDIARILAEKRPRHLVLENVKGLLSHDSGKTFQTILGVLSDLGYRVEWQVLNSKDFGVPQNRERIYFVGHLRGECGGKVFPIARDSGKNLKQLVGGSQGNRVYSTDGVSSTLASQAGGLGAKTGLYAIANTLDANYYKGNSKSGIRHTPRTEVLDNSRIRRLTPLECERLQGFPDNWTEYGQDNQKKPLKALSGSCLPSTMVDSSIISISDTQRYKMCGNAVTTNVVEAVMEGLLNELRD